jgi:ribonuclease-3
MTTGRKGRSASNGKPAAGDPPTPAHSVPALSVPALSVPGLSDPYPSVPDLSVPDLSQLEQKLGYAFVRPGLLALALTHRSHTYEARNGAPPEPILPAHPDQRDQRNAPGSDNEQLEFLGDAVIGLVITAALFREFPHCSEGELTRLRSSLVSRKRMAEMGTELGLGEALLLGRSAEHNGGRKKPALLANAAEAVIAAMYLDAGASGLSVVQAFAERYLVQPELAAMRAALAGDLGRGALRDHKTLLQERVQAANAGKPATRLRYVDIAQSGPPHQRIFLVEARLEDDAGEQTLASAEGSSKKEAQQRAAELALAHWNPDAYRPAEDDTRLRGPR